MLEIWEGATDSNKAFGTLLIYLSKADCKIIYIRIDSLNILEDHLSNRKQKPKVNCY